MDLECSRQLPIWGITSTNCDRDLEPMALIDIRSWPEELQTKNELSSQGSQRLRAITIDKTLSIFCGPLQCMIVCRWRRVQPLQHAVDCCRRRTRSLHWKLQAVSYRNIFRRQVQDKGGSSVTFYAGGGQICKGRLFSVPLEVGPLDCG